MREKQNLTTNLAAICRIAKFVLSNREIDSLKVFVSLKFEVSRFSSKSHLMFNKFDLSQEGFTALV